MSKKFPLAEHVTKKTIWVNHPNSINISPKSQIALIHLPDTVVNGSVPDLSDHAFILIDIKGGLFWIGFRTLLFA